MLSPFPGMDPFIESQLFDDFHHAYIFELKELLVPLVRPKYVVHAERFVFLSDEEKLGALYKPDVLLAESPSDERGAPRGGSVATLEPKIVSLPFSDEDGQAFLTIRSREGRKVVTVIEVLSPTNKEAGKGQREYLTKRANYLRTLTNIVEIDLLRGGARPPAREPLQEADYFTFVIRHGDRSRIEAYGWKLQDRLPVIPVPLSEGDADVGLDLQEAFNRAYDRSGYDYALDYDQEVSPHLSEELQRWVNERLSKK